jgi:hypothetical protein
MQRFNNQEIWARVIARAWADSDFKAHLLADPNGAIEAETGVELPAGLKLRVIEEQDDETVLVLPKVGADLTEEVLEAISGGDGLGQGPCSCLVG